MLQGHWSLLLGAFSLPCLLLLSPGISLGLCIIFPGGRRAGSWWDLGWRAGAPLADSLSEVLSVSLYDLPPGLCLCTPAAGSGRAGSGWQLRAAPLGQEQLPEGILKSSGVSPSGTSPTLTVFLLPAQVLSRGVSGCGPGFGVLPVAIAAEGWWWLLLPVLPPLPLPISATFCINTYPCIKQDIPLISSSS